MLATRRLNIKPNTRIHSITPLKTPTPTLDGKSGHFRGSRIWNKGAVGFLHGIDTTTQRMISIWFFVLKNLYIKKKVKVHQKNILACYLVTISAIFKGFWMYLKLNINFFSKIQLIISYTCAFAQTNSAKLSIDCNLIKFNEGNQSKAYFTGSEAVLWTAKSSTGIFQNANKIENVSLGGYLFSLSLSLSLFFEWQ